MDILCEILPILNVMKRILYPLLFVLLLSCSTPESDGRKIARNENRCAENCIESVQKLESDFVNHFNPKDYTFRSQAIEVYKKQFKMIGEDYYRDIDAAKIQKSKLKGRYANDYKKMEKFEDAYDREKDVDLTTSALLLLSEDVIPPAVIACINGIIPLKPDNELIKTNLVGHSLSEGFEKENCYFSEKWRLDIDENVSIKELVVEDVQNDDGREYSFIASMVLQKDYLSFNTRAQVYYVLPDGEDWKIDFVKSLGIRIIQTHKYDDCIRCEIDEDGWGGTKALFITNISEVQLLVIGQIVANGQNQNFNQIISSGNKLQVGGLFRGGSVSSYKIVTIERMS